MAGKDISTSSPIQQTESTLSNTELNGYKILQVHEEEETLFSATLTDPESDGAVTYDHKHWAIPQEDCGPLCVFGFWHSAVRFFNMCQVVGRSDPRFVLYKCKYIRSDEGAIWINVGRPPQSEYKLPTLTPREGLPKGTDLAEKVMIYGCPLVPHTEGGN